MHNDYFSFKQFTIRQDRCAMKVGTDGVLLGAWAHTEIVSEDRDLRILDIGTGTGLIALMMAQRYPMAHVTAIEIDAEASVQAQENVEDSPFSERIKVHNVALQDYKEKNTFEIIVSNPPYFMDSLKTPDTRRTMARHTDTLTYEVLFSFATSMLSDDGVFAIVLPADTLYKAEECATFSGLFMRERIGIRTTPHKPIKRYLLAFSKHPCEYLASEQNLESEWYRQLTQEFYRGM